MATVRQRSFRIEPELWHQLDLVRDAGHGDTDAAALRWLRHGCQGRAGGAVEEEPWH